MPKPISPDQQIAFQGVVTAGHPTQRPRNSAKVCQNFRVMPGEWLRLRSGRKARTFQASGYKFLQFKQYRDPRYPGATHNLVQIFDGADAKWKWLNLSNWTLNPSWETVINDNYGGSFAQTEQAAAAIVRDRLVFYNGLGVRDATSSTPPFSTYDGTYNRYYGLDAYCPSGTNPTVAFAAGAGYNQVTSEIQIFVGLHNSATGHYGNGVYVGSITTTGATGTITVSNLDRLKLSYNNAIEQFELKRVFYATLDPGQIPYLILNSTLNGPAYAANNETSKSLSIYNYGNGWVVDYDSPMPSTNHPPRPMRDIAYVNGRLYGVLIANSGSGSPVSQQRPDGTLFQDFTYEPPIIRLDGLAYSKAATDIADGLLGNPDEAWPLRNFTPTPNSQVPVRIAPAPDGYRILVHTATATFLVEEMADGYHEWKQIDFELGRNVS